MVVDEAGGAEVDDLDLASGVGLDQDVLGLQVAVDQAQPVDEVQGRQDLPRYLL